MFFNSPRLFRPNRNGFAVQLAPEAQQWILALADRLEELLDTDSDDVRRLFPTAYVDDPERDAGYQILAREELADRRREAVGLMRQTVGQANWTDETLTAWMGIINDVRLVLGTRLDIGEDDDEFDFEGPEGELHLMYHQLGYILHEIVESLTTTLPPVDED